MRVRALSNGYFGCIRFFLGKTRKVKDKLLWFFRFGSPQKKPRQTQQGWRRVVIKGGDHDHLRELMLQFGALGYCIYVS